MTIWSVGNDVKELELLHAAEGNVKLYSHLGTQFFRFLKLRHRLTIWLSHSTLRCLCKKNEIIHLYKALYMNFIVAFLIIATTQISINNGLISKLWFFHSMEYCLVIKEKMSHWFMQPLSSKRSHTRVQTTIPLIYNYRKFRLIYSDSKQVDGWLGMAGRGKRNTLQKSMRKHMDILLPLLWWLFQVYAYLKTCMLIILQ